MNKEYASQEDCILCAKNPEKQREFTVMKRIAKHGNQAIIVVPRMLEEELKPGTKVEMNVKVVREVENE